MDSSGKLKICSTVKSFGQHSPVDPNSITTGQIFVAWVNAGGDILPIRIDTTAVDVGLILGDILDVQPTDVSVKEMNLWKDLRQYTHSRLLHVVIERESRKYVIKVYLDNRVA